MKVVNQIQMEAIELKNVISKIKKKTLLSRLEMTEDRISKLEDESIEFIQQGQWGNQTKNTSMIYRTITKDLTFYNNEREKRVVLKE